jgi:release factor glutamine methyltransferase
VAVWTVSQLLNATAEYLATRGVESARLDAEVLLAHALHCRRLDLYLEFDKVLEKDELDSYRELVDARGKRQPVAQLLGCKEFYSRNFILDDKVLVPRPETELLVDEVLAFFKKTGSDLSIVDIGTGSGIIAITLVLENPACKVLATDISDQALSIAKENAVCLCPDCERLTFIEGDLLDPLLDQGLVFDVIVSNPPYLTELEMQQAEPEVAQCEPRSALCGGADGLDYYRRLADGAAEILVAQGRIFLEIGAGQAEDVGALFENTGHFKVTAVRKDYANLDRIVIAEKTS